MKPKKSLGQNFLESKEIAGRIIKAADLTSDDIVLEVGPGKGILTEELAKQAGKVIAIELDKVLSNLLSNKFSNKKKVEIINDDILKALGSSTSKWRSGLQGQYKVVANIPYYITAPIIRRFLEAENAPSVMILMVQKEVAERIIADPGKMSILSVSVQYYAEPELLFYVGKENFNPVPKVDSAVIRITPRLTSTTFSTSRSGQAKERTNEFFRIVRAGFCAKRKTLANNLSNSLHLEKGEVEEKLKTAGISPAARAQELNVDNWKELARML